MTKTDPYSFITPYPRIVRASIADRRHHPLNGRGQFSPRLAKKSGYPAHGLKESAFLAAYIVRQKIL
jgi:hypothetical protein